MHRRQLLARVMTTGLVLVGGTRLLQAQRTGPISEAEIQILLKAYDEASAVLSQARTSVRLDNRDRRFDPYSMPYFVGEHSPTLFSGYLQPMGPVPDYKWLTGARWEVIPSEAPMSTWWQ